MSDDDRRESVAIEDGKTEAQIMMEMDKKRREEKAKEEMREYEEMRSAEREKEAREIQELRTRREQRKIERADEEKRMAELRSVEDQKRRAEEDERQRKKREEEQKKREERERRKKEDAERMKQGNRPNFIINKRSGGIPAINGDEPSKEDIQKSKEQMEAERKAVLEQRIKPLSTDGLGTEQLKEKAKELYQCIYNLESEKYDLEKQYQQQNMDMMELAERARQMNKGGKGQKVNMSSQSDAANSTLSRAPPKVAMYSQYERVKDPRSFGDRKNLYVGPMYQDEWTRVQPQHQVIMGEQGAEIIGNYSESNAGGDAGTGEGDPAMTNGEA